MDRGRAQLVGRACVGVVLGCALISASNAWADNPTPSQAITELNAWRAQLGESAVSTTDVTTYDTGCQDHNNYEQNHNTLTHFETDTNPANGYTADGAAAGPDSVLAEQTSSPSPAPAVSQLPAPTWDGAVFHRQAVLQPRLANIGYASTTFGSGSGPYHTWTCLWDQNIEGSPYNGSRAAIDNSRTTASLSLYPSPANGAYDVPTAFPGNESPDPGQETGVNGATLGWLISVEINGPWANSGGGGIVWAHGVTATLEPDGTTTAVPVVVSECGSSGCANNDPGGTAEGAYFSGGFGIFPLQALAAGTTYHVEAKGTVTDNTNSGSPVTYPFDKTWYFSTGSTYTTSSDCTASATGAGAEPGVLTALQVSVNGRGTVSGSGISCPSTCYGQYTAGSSVTLTASPPSGEKFTGWSGACSGTQLTCQLVMSGDETVHATFVKIGTPTISAGSLIVGGGKATLKFTLHAGRYAPLIKSVTVTPPRGLTFATTSTALRQGISIVGKPTFTPSATSSKLTIRLANPTSTSAISIASPALRAAKNLPYKGLTLSFGITPVDATGKATALHLTFHY